MRQIRVWSLLAVALIACDGDEPFAEIPDPGLTILAGANVSDTISTTPAQRLVVEVRHEDGEPVSGTPVQFETTDPDLMHVSPVNSPFWLTVTGAETDADGRAEMRVRLGERTGKGKIVISVPLLELTDTAHYTILPGNPAYVGLAPRDTAITIGEEFSYRGTVADRNGNARQDPATFELEGDAITQNASNDFHAREIGVAKVRIRATVEGAAAVDSGTVTVVPAGTIAWADDAALGVTNVAGKESRSINSPGRSPSWEPGGARLVASNNDGLVVIDDNNIVNALPTPGFSSPTWPEWSRDGFIYFSGLTPNGRRLVRVRPDGTGLETIVADEAANTPSPSPDSTRVVYVNGEDSGPLRILNLETRTVPMLLDVVDAQAPRWSPDGNWIAFTREFGELWLIRPDGTDTHRIGQHGLWPGMTWSPDSRWILGVEQSVTLVDVNTGLMWYLHYRREHPAWKR